jgi:MFS family permease
VTRPVIGATSAAWQVIALRATDRIGKGVRTPPRDAVIADATAAAMRGRAFGFHRAMDHAGAVVGPLVAWVLLSVAGLTPDGVILWSVVPGVMAVGVAAWALRGTGSGVREPGSGASAPALSPLIPDPRPPIPAGQRSRIVFALVVLFALARFPETLLLLRLQDLRLSVALVPLVWAALHVIRTLGSYPGGKLADAFGPRRIMLAGWILYALVCVGLATATTALAGVGWFLVFGFVASLTESPERAFVAGFAAGRGTGSRFGLYHASVGMATLVGGLAFGTTYARMGGPVALGLSAGASGLLALGLMLRPRA